MASSKIIPTPEEEAKITQYFEKLTLEVLIASGMAMDMAQQAIADGCPFLGTYSSRDANNIYTLRLSPGSLEELIEAFNVECINQRMIDGKQQLKIAKAMYIVGQRNFGFEDLDDNGKELLILYFNYIILKKIIKDMAKFGRKEPEEEVKVSVKRDDGADTKKYWDWRNRELREGGKWRMPYGYPHSPDIWYMADAIKRF